MRKLSGWSALVLFAVALALVALGFFEGRSGKVLATPLELRPGQKVTHDFTVPFTADYDISVQFSRTVPHEQLTQLLSGENVINAEVLEDGRKLSVRKYYPPARLGSTPWYKLVPDNRTSDVGNLAFSDDWIGQIIIGFSAQRGKHYRASCNVLRADAELFNTNPTLVIAITPGEIKDRLVPTALFLLGAIAAAICALVFSGIYLFQIRKSYAQSERERH